MKNISRILGLLLLVTLASNSSAEQGVLTLDARVDKLERMMDSGGLLQLMQEIDRLKSEVNLLRGQLEEKDFALAELQRRQRELYADIEQRFKRLQQANAVVATPVPSQTDQAVTLVEETPTAVVSIADDDKSAYQAAYALVKAQDFAGAEQQFAAFATKFPKSEYTDNAYYWLGEVQLVQKKYTDALKSFHKVFDFPESVKRADALLKIGFAYYELEQYPQARKFLEQLLKIYPESAAAKLAQPRLKKMDSEGR